MSKQRLGIIIAASLGMIATFMPWFIFPNNVGTVYGGQAGGGITFILFLVPIIICLLKDKSMAIEGEMLYGAVIPAIGALLYGGYQIFHHNSTSISVDFGVYIVIIAGSVLPIIAFFIKDKISEEVQG